MKKILLVFGTRPEAIKMAPLLIELKKYPKDFNVTVCVTAQHREMLDQVLAFFEIKPDIDLNIMVEKQSLSYLTANVLIAMSDTIIRQKPNIILVHGDTTTSFATSLAAFYKGVNIGHVEAGLRTYNMEAPFPEEFNRKIVSNIAKFHFAPTNLSKKNLLGDGISQENIWVTGNTVIDALNFILSKFKINNEYRLNTKKALENFLNFDLAEKKIILVTGHRRENFGKGFENICMSLRTLSKKYPLVCFVYPTHLNPMVLEPVKKLLGKIENIKILKPLMYEQFIFLLKHSYGVLTDSGGLQEEASSLGIPVLVMRDTTERPEAISSGVIKMVGSNQENIVNNVSKLLENKIHYNNIAVPNQVYGDGLASKRIVKILRHIK